MLTWNSTQAYVILVCGLYWSITSSATGCQTDFADCSLDKVNHMADQSCFQRLPLNPGTKPTIRHQVTALIVLVSTLIDCNLVGGNFVTVAPDDQPNTVKEASGLAWLAGHVIAADGSSKLNPHFDEDGGYDQLLYQTAATEEDGSSLKPSTPFRGRLHQPASRRASSSGLRLIGLGKRPSGASSNNGSPLRYIGLGKKRASPLRYIGIGRRDGQDLVDDSTAGSETFSTGEVDGPQVGRSRRRRNVGMRLIGLGRRSGYDSGSHSMTSALDEDDYDMGDDYRLRDVGQQWRHVKRAIANVDGVGHRRVQLRRWSSATGNNVDPALLRMGIGK